MGKFDVGISVDIEDVFSELKAHQQEEFFKENLESVLSIDEAIECYDSEKLKRYIIDNWSKEDIEELLSDMFAEDNFSEKMRELKFEDGAKWAITLENKKTIGGF